MKLTKQAFAKAVGISKPTLYKWISQNKDGIKDYVSADGIDASIFDAEPWASLCKEKPPEAEKTNPDEPAEIARLRAEVETLKALNEKNEGIIELLNAQIVAKDAQIQALLVISQTQLKALPKPRRTPKEFLTDIFTGKGKDRGKI